MQMTGMQRINNPICEHDNMEENVRKHEAVRRIPS